MWRSLTKLPIRWRLTIAYVAVIWATMTVAGLVLSYLIESQYTYGYQRVLASHASLVKGVIEDQYSQTDHAPAITDQTARELAGKINARVQVYDTHHKLLADSSHGQRDIDPAGPLKGFSCRLCHPEARSPQVMSASQTLERNGSPVGSASVSVSLFGIKQASARSRRVIFSALVIAALVAAILSQRLAFSIAKPITEMSMVAKRMAEGDLSQHVRLDGTSEINQLAASFNAMAMQIRKMLDQMAGERDTMETILTTMADGIIITDAAGRVILFNKSSEQLFGRMAGDVIGEPIAALELHADLPGMVQETLASQRIVRKELRIESSGTSLSAYTTAVKDANPDVKGAVVVLYDLTEIRRHENAQREFVANVSHELRTPITAVRVTAEALLSGAKNDPELLVRFLGTLVKESERLSALVDDLLEVAKLESGRVRVHRGEVDLSELVERVLAIRREQAYRSAVTLSAAIPEITVYADERQLEQVISNLTDNAIKYTHEGGNVLVQAEETEDAVRISVSDSGIGIPASDVPRIFERFYRVDKARSRDKGGTGLGLSIVKGIVDAHNGTISVETGINEGSTFTVTLPKSPAPPQSEKIEVITS